MAGERRLEYEKGPPLEDGDEDETDEEPSDDGGEGPVAGRVRRPLSVAPWKAGIAGGVGAFAVVYAVIYQLVGALVASGALGGVEAGPSRWIVAGLTMLGSHGSVIEEGGEPVAAGFATYTGLVSQVTALVPVLVLALAGYLLVRSVRLEGRVAAGLAFGSLTAVYVGLAVVLGTLARWSPDEASGGTMDPGGSAAPDEEVLAVAVDAGMILTTTNTVLVAVAIGAGVALLSRRLERPVSASSDDPVEPRDD